MAVQEERRAISARTGLIDPGSTGSGPQPADAMSAASDDPSHSGAMFRLPDAELARMFDEACNVALPERIGRFRVLDLLGAGGMGVVYRAEQDHPRRLVALKTLRLGMADRRMTARFENEIASLARLRHPNIAQIYDAGVAATVWGPQPYIAMELIDGPRLTDFVQQRRLKTTERLRLFAELCDAVEHAHQRGVIHRDLKPGNILVQEETKRRRDEETKCAAASPSRPSQSPVSSTSSLRLSVSSSLSAQPKILDFGVARLLHRDASKTLATTAGEILGTLAYMSPEQVSGSPDAVNTRSDVYALGCILHELLTGHPPIQVADVPVSRASERIRNDVPPPLRQHDASLRGDLEIIVAKALEKDPDRRYARAALFADDIRRFLASEPIAARRPSAAYVIRKWVSRHRVACALSGLVALSIVGGATGLIAGMLRAHRESDAKQRLLQAAIQGVSGIASEVLPELTPIAGTRDTRLTLLEKLLPMRDLLIGFDGNDPKLLAAQADVLDAVANLEDERSDRGLRLKNRNAVLAARRRLTAVTPHDRRQMLRFAIDHVRIGDIVKECGDIQIADDWYTKAFEIQRKLMNAAPDCIDAQIDLTWSHARLADTARQLDRLPRMREQLEAAETLLEQLLTVTGGSEEIRLLDCRQQCLALWTDYFRLQGSSEETHRTQRSRVECLRRLNALEPSNRTYAVRTATALLNVAHHEAVGRNNCAAARADLADAEPLLEKLARLEPRNAEVFELRIDAGHTKACVEANEGRPRAGLCSALRARGLLRAQLDWVPSDLTNKLLSHNSRLVQELAQACGFVEWGELAGRENDEWIAEFERLAASESQASDR